MRTKKRILSVGLILAILFALLMGCGGKEGTGNDNDDGKVKESSGKDAKFTWWIASSDGQGQYYDTYEQNPVVQYVNQQYWNVEKGGMGSKETGNKLEFSFLTPVAGLENDNFNTMIGTGEYPEIMALTPSTESPKQLLDSGIVMDITEYVEKYMPNYLAFLDKNPGLKSLVQVSDEEGNVRYCAIYPLGDGADPAWEGTCYRRDWIVKYAKPSEYVWDWESRFVKENGHPEVTPLARAIEKENMNGWKKNDVVSFSADYGENPADDYTDNVVFPSGTSNPLTISDWEWMFEAFDKAFEERGWAEDVSAYGFSIPSYGYNVMGDVVSSFGGGTGTFYTKDGKVTYDGVSDNFKAYLECMRTWYENGWLDSNFHTRTSDMFFQIDSTGVNQGKVGMWCGMASTLGTAIRTSCQDASDQADAYVMGAALPINDMYGDEEQMFKEPDALYQASRLGMPVVITNKAEGKDLPTLFTYLDWTYTMEGSKTLRIGLNAEQYASVKLDPDLYAELDIEAAYTESVGENGKTIIKKTFNPSNTEEIAVMGQRMNTGISLCGNTDEYVIDEGQSMVIESALEQWGKYLNTGNVTDYVGLLDSNENDMYNKAYTLSMEYQSQKVPEIIRGSLSWDEYVRGMDAIETDVAADVLQKYISFAEQGGGMR